MKMHPTTVRQNMGDRDLGAQIVRLRYDKLHDVVMGMVDEFGRQSFHDAELGRVKLANLLWEARNATAELEKVLDKILQLCEKYIAEEIKVQKSTRYAKFLPDNYRFTGYTFRL